MTPYRYGSLFQFLKGAAIIAAPFVSASNVLAQDVQITSQDGELRVEGRIIGFDGTYLRLETGHGVLTLDYASSVCEGSTCPDPNRDAPILRFSGMTRLGDVILPALAEGFARDRGYIAERYIFDERTSAYAIRTAEGLPLVSFVFRATNTTEGFAELLSDATDVLLSARELTSDELTAANSAGLGELDAPRQMRLLAFDALVPIVAPGLARHSISLEDIARAYAGEVINWQELGGADVPITLHLLDLSDGQAEAFVEGALRSTDRNLSEAVQFHSTNAELVAAVVEERGSLGIASFSASGNAQPLVLEDSCGLVANTSASSVKTEDYPLTMPMYLYAANRRIAPAGIEFLDWLTSHEAQIILRRAGVLAQTPVPISIQNQGQRFITAISGAGDEVALEDLQRMVGFLNGQVRLSLTFRFDDDAQQLDTASRQHARYLARVILSGRYDDRRLAFVGFSDGEGSAGPNIELSRNRAEIVRQAVVDALGDQIPENVHLESFGFGESLPIGCDDTIWGRRSNRRVELWVGSLE